MPQPQRAKPKWIVPEVVQTSSMDCGPASLKSLLEGHGIRVGYGRLREVCQTSIDGTSIDSLEAVSTQLGLPVAQVMIPPDHVLLPETNTLPGIAVTALPGGAMHFIVLWRRHGRWVQVMDPGTGRRWVRDTALLDELHVNLMPVPAADWREWAGTEEFLAPLRHRIAALGASRIESRQFVDEALLDETWQSLATLDAAVRMVAQLIVTGGVRRGADAVSTCRVVAERALEDPSLIRTVYWSAQATDPDEDGEPQIMLVGCVLVSVDDDAGQQGSQDEDGEAIIPKALVSAVTAEAPSAGRKLLSSIREDGLLTPSVCAAALSLSAAAVLVEALLFRGSFHVGQYLAPGPQRLGALAALIGFLVAMVLLELPIAATALRLGRHLEARLRVAYLAKLPRLGDRYFHSRLASDMAERGHMLQLVRRVPELGAQMLRTVFSLALTVGGIIWLDPSSAGLAIMVATLAVALPLLFQPLLTERDLRMRTHEGALTRFYFDALVGMIPIRAHGADRSVRRQHESLLLDWQAAGLRVQRAAVFTEGLLALSGLLLSAWLVARYLDHNRELAGILLLAYWSLQLPALGEELAMSSRQYPALRNVTHRVMELLLAPSEVTESTSRPAVRTSNRGMGIHLEGVHAIAGGHTILEDIDLEIEPGQDVAIVGPSGAGKSSLVGLLLGWHHAAHGRILVDGEPLEGSHLARIRREIAWVDPEVYLWNRSLFENLRYGLGVDAAPAVGDALRKADLKGVLERLPDGLQTTLGESGALVSGGEGQRVRLGRALLRPGSRLVILDEPFRGLDREQRRELLARAREHWADATFLCITHDIEQTLDFDRVVVIDRARIVEDGTPRQLASIPDTTYRRLLDAERTVRDSLGAAHRWRRWTLDAGQIEERRTGES